MYGLIDPITGSMVLGSFIVGYFLNKSIFSPFGTCPTKAIQFDGKIMMIYYYTLYILTSLCVQSPLFNSNLEITLFTELGIIQFNLAIL